METLAFNELCQVNSTHNESAGLQACAERLEVPHDITVAERYRWARLANRRAKLAAELNELDAELEEEYRSTSQALQAMWQQVDRSRATNPGDFIRLFTDACAQLPEALALINANETDPTFNWDVYAALYTNFPEHADRICQHCGAGKPFMTLAAADFEPDAADFEPDAAAAKTTAFD